MTDQNTRFLIPALHVRGQIVQLDRSYQSVISNAAYPTSVARLLGQALAAVSALGSIIKLRGSIILQTHGNGMLRTLVAQANNAGEIRGLAHGYEHALPTADFKTLLGTGRLVITIDGEGGKRYQGIVALEGAKLSAVLDAYFAQSEQLRTHIMLASNDRLSACYLLQQLPVAATEASDDDWEYAKIISDTLTETELLDLGPQQILHRLLHDQDVQIFEPDPLKFHCRCSRDKIIPAIVKMGQEEAMQLLEEEGQIRADCEFCNQSYTFDRVDVASLFKLHVKTPSKIQ